MIPQIHVDPTILLLNNFGTACQFVARTDIRKTLSISWGSLRLLRYCFLTATCYTVCPNRDRLGILLLVKLRFLFFLPLAGTWFAKAGIAIPIRSDLPCGEFCAYCQAFLLQWLLRHLLLARWQRRWPSHNIWCRRIHTPICSATRRSSSAW